MNVLKWVRLISVLLSVNFSTAYSQPGSWLEVEIGIIGSASKEVLESAMERVSEEKFDGLLIVLDTPGGALEATRSMVKAIMASPSPVIVWVGPSGARAGSAGAFITLSAHVAVMASGTNIGAAHPVQAGGQNIEDGDIKKKIENDTIAFMESIATTRGRNKEMAISFVVNSVSITAAEALEHKVIDDLVETRSQLITKLNGKKINIDEKTELTLNLEGVQFVKYEKNIKEEFLEIISNPNLFYLLFVAGLIGIGFELTHPGSLFPGVIGGISMILALIATSVLPVSFGAMLLILVAIAFMVGEVFIPSFGILGIGGLVAFIVGSVLLVDPNNEEGLRISWYTIAPGVIAVAGFSLLVGYLVLRAEKSKVVSGDGGMLGKEGVAIDTFVNGVGKIKVDGEIWNAKEERAFDVSMGDKIEIMDRDGLTFIVRADPSVGGPKVTEDS